MSDLDQRIDEMLESNSDPYKVAQEIARTTDSRHLRDYLADALPVYVRNRLRAHRFPPAAAIRNLDRFRKDAHWIDGRWVLAHKMSAKDCAWLAEDYTQRADGNGDWAEVWYDMSRLLERKHVRTVSQLSDEDIATVLRRNVEKRAA